MTEAPRTGKGLVLIGYRGTGKSTVGRILADRLRLPLVDADAVLELRFNRPVSRIFQESGEPRFRDWEEETIAEATSGPPCVLATGGGAVLSEVNRARLKAFGTVVWLSAGADVLSERLSREPGGLSARPPLTAAGTLAEVATVLAARLPIYAGLADVEVSTEGRTPDEVAVEVLRTVSQIVATD